MPKSQFSLLVSLGAAMILLPALVFVLGRSQPLVPASQNSLPESSFSQDIPDPPKETEQASGSLPAIDSHALLYYRVQDHQTGEIHLMSANDYIKGVVAAEMPADFEIEALKAQAVAAHTYAILQKSANDQNPDPALNGADFSTDPTHYQAYLSPEELQEFYGHRYPEISEKIGAAVDAVINQVLVCDGQPIAAAFHAISGGITENAASVWGNEVSYLVPVVSEGDRLSPDYEVSVCFSSEEIRNALLTGYTGITLPDDPAEWLVINSRTASGMVTEVIVGDAVLSGVELRGLLGLRSANFEITYDAEAEEFCFTTFGYGHGVGMSQYGADYMARQGKSYVEILEHYYTGATLYTISPDLESPQI
ncbi:MAG TPA: stage II sporulation protein D [Firmicutes bacterium]|nr:stage II sporulation protein D [Bacillota bacterium]